MSVTTSQKLGGTGTGKEMTLWGGGVADHTQVFLASGIQKPMAGISGGITPITFLDKMDEKWCILVHFKCTKRCFGRSGGGRCLNWVQKLGGQYIAGPRVSKVEGDGSLHPVLRWMRLRRSHIVGSSVKFLILVNS